MPRNGSGTYSLPSGNPVVTGTSVSSTWANNTLSDIATALTGSLTADGQTPWTGNQSASGNKLTNLGSSSASSDAATRGDVSSLIAATPSRGYIAGLALSTAGSSATFSVAAGAASDSTNAYMMALASSYNKTTSAWSAGSGNGSLDTGAIANSTTYHVFLIRRTDTGVVDVLISTSPSAPTMPASYTQFRRIGSMKTNGSAQWTKFIQDGDFFQWDVPVNDVSANNPGTAAVTRTLSVPTGINVRAAVRAEIAITSTSGSATVGGMLSDLAITDTAPLLTTTGLTVVAAKQANDNYTGCETTVRTNTSAQVRSRLTASDSGITLYVSTYGWYDTRGKDA